jgi:hypothetical protein
MDDTLRTLAKQHYDSIDLSNFERELSRVQIIKKSFKKYYKCGQFNLRLNLNHVIILFNFFNSFASNLLFREIPEDHYPILITLLTFLNRCPIIVPITNIPTSMISLDPNIERGLENL